MAGRADAMRRSKKKKPPKSPLNSVYSFFVPERYEDSVSKALDSLDKKVHNKKVDAGYLATHPAQAPGILGLRLMDDTKDAAVGLFPGLYDMGKNAVYDFNSGYTGKRDLRDRHQSRLYERNLKPIGDDYAHVYGPAFNGDFQTTADRIAEHPLGPVLDVMTVVTLGAGAGAKGGVAASRSSKAGSTLDRAGRAVSGMERVPVPASAPGVAPSMADARAFIAKETAGQRRVRGATIKGTSDEVLLPPKRVIVGSTAKLDGDTGFSPRPMLRNADDRDAQRSVLTDGGEAEELGRYSSNPAIRVRQRSFDALAEAMPRAWGFGADARQARLRTQREVRQERVRVATSGAPEFSNVVARMNPSRKRRLLTRATNDPLLQVGFHYLAQGVDPEMKLAQLTRDLDRLESMGAPEATVLRKRLDAIQSGDPAKVKLAENVAELRGMTVDELAAEADNFLSAYADRDMYLARGRTRQKLLDSYVSQDAAALNRQRPLLNEALAAVRPVSEQTTSALREASGNPDMGLGVDVMPQRIAGVAAEATVKPPAVIPHTVDRVDYTPRQKGAYSAGDVSKAHAPDSTKKRTGVADRFGQEALNPKAVLWAHRQANIWLTQKRLLQSIIARRRPISAGEKVPVGWVKFPKSKWESFFANGARFLDEEMTLAFGDSPQLAEMKAIFEEALYGKGPADDFIVPKRYADKLHAQMTPTGRVRGIDEATSAWRLATVSALRPAFLANNIIGQTALLLLSQGTYSMIGTLLSKEGRGLMMDKANASIVGHGMNRELSRETKRMSRHANDAGTLNRRLHLPLEAAASINDVIGKFSGSISDDPFRRLAFANEIMKPAKAVLKARRQSDPSFTLRQAAEEVMSDERLMDRIERKVLGDLVDFEDLSLAERRYLRRVSPFYSWIKGSSKLTAKLLLERPELANVLYNVGEMGDRNQRERWGDVPDYVLGQIIRTKSGLPNEKGLTKTWTTQQISPFVTPVDQMAQILHPFGLNPSGAEYGAENLLSAANPVAKAIFAGLGGRDPFTGMDAEGQTGLSRMLNSYIAGFPQYRAQHNKGKDYGVMQHPGWASWRAYGGDLTRYVSLEEARDKAAKGSLETYALPVPAPGSKEIAGGTVNGMWYGVLPGKPVEEMDSGSGSSKRKKTRRGKKRKGSSNTGVQR